MMNTSSLVQKLGSYCNAPELGRSLARSPERGHAGACAKARLTHRDDGMSYGDYVEQLTDLLFLKMADERWKPPYDQPSPIPARYAWPKLLALDGDELFDHYRHTLEELGTGKGTLALIYGKAQNMFQDPAKLRRVIVDLIDAENWSALGADVKGDAYEGRLERNAHDITSSRVRSFLPSVRPSSSPPRRFALCCP
jgi:hypothetical protein